MPLSMFMMFTSCPRRRAYRGAEANQDAGEPHQCNDRERRADEDGRAVGHRPDMEQLEKDDGLVEPGVDLVEASDPVELLPHE